MSSNYLSNITSSEGLLSRFSDICINLNYEGYESNKIHALIKQEFGLTNNKVRNRHLNIMQKLKLLNIRYSDGVYVYSLGPNGKLIKNFNMKLRMDSHNLQDSEKIVYSYLLFNKYYLQFFPIVDIIYKKGKINIDELIIRYFNNIKESKIWSQNIIEKGLFEWERKQKLIRSYQNRFTCME